MNTRLKCVFSALLMCLLFPLNLYCFDSTQDISLTDFSQGDIFDGKYDGYEDKYFGKTFIHDENIDTQKDSFISEGASAVNSFAVAAAVSIKDDFCYVENNKNISTLVQYDSFPYKEFEDKDREIIDFPFYLPVGELSAKSHSLGLGIVSGGVGVNNGNINSSVYGGEVGVSKKASLNSLAVGMWATKSGDTPFFENTTSADLFFKEGLLINNGNINVEASNFIFSGQVDTDILANSYAYGMYLDDYCDAVNIGSIESSVFGAGEKSGNLAVSENFVSSRGITSGSGSKVFNKGFIFSQAYNLSDPDGLKGTADIGSGNMNITSEAVGIYGQENSVIRNDGIINAVNHSSENISGDFTAAGIAVEKGSLIINNGEINSRGDLGNVNVFGIVTKGDASIVSNGKINVFSSSQSGLAFDVYSMEGTLNVLRYTIELDDQTDIMNGLWSHSKRGSFDFGSSVLFVKISEDTLFNTPYQVDRLVKGEKSDFAYLDGNFTDDIKAKFINGKESVILEYNPSYSCAGVSVSNSYKFVSGALLSVNHRLFNFSLKSPDKNKKSFYITPFAKKIDNDNYDFSGNGFVTGLNTQFFPKLALGFFIGSGSGDIDFTKGKHQNRNIDSDIFFAGLNGLYKFSENFYGSASGSFFKSKNDFTDKDPLNQETADYKNQGFLGSASGIYRYNVSKKIVVEPTLGFNFMHLVQDSYRTKHTSFLSTKYDRISESEISAFGALALKGNYNYKKTRIIPELSLFTSNMLTSGNIGSGMHLMNEKKVVKEELGDNSYGFELKGVVEKGNISVEAGIKCEKNNKADEFVGEWTLMYSF